MLGEAHPRVASWGSLAAPVVGDPARLPPLLLDEWEAFDDVSEELPGFDVGTGDVRAGGNQTLWRDGDTGIVIRA